MNTLSFERDIRVLRDSTNTDEFCAVIIDSVSVATNAKRFDASTDKIVSTECDFCYSCGIAEVTVRRTDDRHVIWFVDLDKDVHQPSTLSQPKLGVR